LVKVGEGVLVLVAVGVNVGVAKSAGKSPHALRPSTATHASIDAAMRAARRRAYAL
jgi:hypothetical protein